MIQVNSLINHPLNYESCRFPCLLMDKLFCEICNNNAKFNNIE